MHTSRNTGDNGWSAFAASTLEGCKTYCIGFTGDDGATCSRITFVSHTSGNMCWMGLTDDTEAAEDPYILGPPTGGNTVEAFNYG